MTWRDRIRRIHRQLEGWQWLALTALGMAGLYVLAPHQLPLLLWVIVQLAAGGVAGYFLDRWLFPRARMDDLDGDPVELRHARYRRAGLIAAGAVGAAVGM